MEQQSNKNFDGLFQKAAEEYPLKTDNANWNFVSAKLNSAHSVSDNRKNKKWKYAALALLLLLSSFLLIDNLNKKSPGLLIAKDKELTQKNNLAFTPNTQPFVLNKSMQQNSNIQTQNYSLSHITRPTPDEIASTNLHKPGLEKTGVNENQPPYNAAEFNTATEQNNNSGNVGASQINNIADNTELSKSPQQQQSQNPDVNNNINKNLRLSEAANNKKSVHLKLGPQPKTFYGTLYFSPGFSSVKFQKLTKPGYMVGVSLGYRLNNRLSTEIGLQRSHNDFYSSGKYFDKSNSRLKPSYKVDALSGNNKLTEVPVLIRYNLLKNNDHFFAAAGTTLAMITHSEQYDYSVRKNGTEKNVLKDYSSQTHAKFFSSVNLSVGYQTSLYHVCNVKVEPFYQASLKGVGIGNLPINTFGVSVGLVKNLK